MRITLDVSSANVSAILFAYLTESCASSMLRRMQIALGQYVETLQEGADKRFYAGQLAAIIALADRFEKEERKHFDT